MAKTKIREIFLRESKGTFSIFSKQKTSKKDYNFEGISALRQLFSNEKARILDVVKYKDVKSIYDLAKILERPFKAVFDDVKLLQRFGLIELLKEKTKKRVRHKPIIGADNLIIHINI